MSPRTPEPSAPDPGAEPREPETRTPSVAEDAFAEFLELVEAGQACDFDAFCGERPALTPALRRMHAQWSAMHLAFEGIAESAGADDVLVPTPGEPGRLTRYELGDEIARGGMGRILRAFDSELRREVALKLQRGPHGDLRRRRRFLEEAQIAAQLDHPGIAPVHELGVDAAGRPFFTMKLVRGRHLGELIRDSAAGGTDWPRPRLLGVLLRVCEAIAFAHERGVVHRDLKPENVMVGRFGETYVMDWGLAHVSARGADAIDDRHGAPGGGPMAGSDAGSARAEAGGVDTVRRDLESSHSGSHLLTREGDVLGTPSYMAPEQADGASTDPSVDVYAVGAMLHHVLAGRAPYDDGVGDGALSADDVLTRLRAGPPPSLGDAVPAELRAICERAMARAPTERYPGMAELADDLRAFLEVRTVKAYATGRFAELSKWVARNRALSLGAVVSVVALAVAAAGIALLWLDAVASRRQADGVTQQLRTELERRAFRSARQSLQFEDSREAGDALWRVHLAGTMPRASRWALLELARRDPYLATLPLGDDLRPAAFCAELGAVLLGASDGRLEVRDESTLELRRRLLDEGPAMMSLAVLPGGALAVCGHASGVVRIVDLNAERVVRELAAHEGSVRYVVGGGGSGFATCGADGVVSWWEDVTASPRQLIRFRQGVTSLAMRPGFDGVAAGDERGNIEAIALDGSWRVRYRIGSRVTGLAFGTRDTDLWAGGTDHQLRYFDFLDGSRNASWPTRNGTCRQLARDLDGSLLVGGWWRVDRVASDGASNAPVALRGISRWALDAGRRRLVTTGAVCGLGLLDLAATDRRRPGGNASVALSADGRRFATFVEGQVVVCDVDSGAELIRLPRGRIGPLRLDAQGRLVSVAGGAPARVDVHAVDSGDVVMSLEGAADDAFGDCTAFAPTGREMAVVVGAGEIVRRRPDGEVLGSLSFDGTVIRVAYGGDGRTLAAIGRGSHAVRIYDLDSGAVRDLEFTATLPNGSASALSAVALSGDGRRLAVGTWQGTVLVRDLDDPAGATAATSLAAHAGTIWSLAFDPRDPGLLITSGGSQGIAAWDLDTNECCFQAVDDVASQVQLSEDGRTLACLLPDGVLLLDLTYRQRHIAGTLEYQLQRLRGDVAVPPGREAELRAWAAAVMAEPWPRWQ